MRYADGGGLDARGRACREAVRLQAAQWFAEGVAVPVIAGRLRVTPKSVYEWRTAWRHRGVAALVSKGHGGSRCRLSGSQLARLEQQLDLGPAANGWVDDQRWTLSRVATLIGRLFHVRYTVRGVSYLLHRLGWSTQVPTRRAVERDDAAVAVWREETWSRVRPSPTSWAPGSVLRTRPGSR